MAIWKANKSNAMASSPVKQIILNKCSSLGKKPSVDIPKGHFPVYVGENRNRYIVPLRFLSCPNFRCFLQQAEEEFGFHHENGITLPCDEQSFCSVFSMPR
ncbi:auxin-responsive protein SAUR50-like [Andrographis paniculata]|uniref:auxin-responsive protein SAUR50-like n=1 Tax=Andrographis paniculata TaxID=175694 RepID=UPI0021E84C13|nr:auxin-responsive protein SAUR50-like [Andrographis paniculata]